MNYEIVFAKSFRRSVKRLKKRYPRVKEDVATAIRVIIESPRLGVVIPKTGGIRKLRVRSTDMGRGKSGGFRLLYFLEDHPSPRIYLLLLYAKTDQEDVTRSELQSLLSELEDEQEY